MAKIDQNYIDDLLLKIRAREVVEHEKLDIKREWYKLNTPEGSDEFCKDISAIANTTSYEEGIIIIGVDEKKADLINSPFKMSGIKDESDLRGIVVKKVNRPPDYILEEISVNDGKKKPIKLCVIRIPPSYTKPHILKSYKKNSHYTPIRKGTSIHSATRDDYEIMFYDRTKFEPENRIEVNVYNPKLDFNSRKLGEHHYISATAYLVLDNSGRRPATITGAKLDLAYITKILVSDNFKGDSWTVINTTGLLTSQQGSFPAPILIGPNQTLTCTMDFLKHVGPTHQDIIRDLLRQYRNLESYEYRVDITTISKAQFISNVFGVTPEP